MDGDSDGNRSERSRVRENMEGVGLFRDRFKMCEKKTKTKNKNEGCTIRPAQKKMGPMAACIKRGLSPAQKKRGLRAGLRPRV